MGVWCLGLSLPSPTGLGSLRLAFVALRLRQSSVGPLWLLAYRYRALAFVCSSLSVFAEGGLGLQDWERGIQLLGLLG